MTHDTDMNMNHFIHLRQEMRDEECSEHWGVGSVRCDIRSVGGGGGVTQNYQLSYSRSKLS